MRHRNEFGDEGIVDSATMKVQQRNNNTFRGIPLLSACLALAVLPFFDTAFLLSHLHAYKCLGGSAANSSNNSADTLSACEAGGSSAAACSAAQQSQRLRDAAILTAALGPDGEALSVDFPCTNKRAQVLHLLASWPRMKVAGWRRALQGPSTPSWMVDVANCFPQMYFLAVLVWPQSGLLWLAVRGSWHQLSHTRIPAYIHVLYLSMLNTVRGILSLVNTLFSTAAGNGPSAAFHTLQAAPGGWVAVVLVTVFIKGPFMGQIIAADYPWILVVSVAQNVINGICHTAEALVVASRCPQFLPDTPVPRLIRLAWLGCSIATFVSLLMDGAWGYLRGRRRRSAQRHGVAGVDGIVAARELCEEDKPARTASSTSQNGKAGGTCRGAAAVVTAIASGTDTCVCSAADTPATQPPGSYPLPLVQSTASARSAALRRLTRPLRHQPHMLHGRLTLHLAHINPEDLPADWLPRLQEYLHTRDPNLRITGHAVWHGSTHLQLELAWHDPNTGSGAGSRPDVLSRSPSRSWAAARHGAAGGEDDVLGSSISDVQGPDGAPRRVSPAAWQLSRLAADMLAPEQLLGVLNLSPPGGAEAHGFALAGGDVKVEVEGGEVLVYSWARSGPDAHRWRLVSALPNPLPAHAPRIVAVRPRVLVLPSSPKDAATSTGLYISGRPSAATSAASGGRHTSMVQSEPSSRINANPRIGVPGTTGGGAGAAAGAGAGRASEEDYHTVLPAFPLSTPDEASAMRADMGGVTGADFYSPGVQALATPAVASSEGHVSDIAMGSPTRGAGHGQTPIHGNVRVGVGARDPAGYELEPLEPLPVSWAEVIDPRQAYLLGPDYGRPVAAARPDSAAVRAAAMPAPLINQAAAAAGQVPLHMAAGAGAVDQSMSTDAGAVCPAAAAAAAGGADAGQALGGFAPHSPAIAWLQLECRHVDLLRMKIVVRRETATHTGSAQQQQQQQPSSASSQPRSARVVSSSALMDVCGGEVTPLEGGMARATLGVRLSAAELAAGPGVLVLELYHASDSSTPLGRAVVLLVRGSKDPLDQQQQIKGEGEGEAQDQQQQQQQQQATPSHVHVLGAHVHEHERHGGVLPAWVVEVARLVQAADSSAGVATADAEAEPASGSECTRSRAAVAGDGDDQMPQARPSSLPVHLAAANALASGNRLLYAIGCFMAAVGRLDAAASSLSTASALLPPGTLLGAPNQAAGGLHADGQPDARAGGGDGGDGGVRGGATAQLDQDFDMSMNDEDSLFGQQLTSALAADALGACFEQGSWPLAHAVLTALEQHEHAHGHALSSSSQQPALSLLGGALCGEVTVAMPGPAAQAVQAVRPGGEREREAAGGGVGSAARGDGPLKRKKQAEVVMVSLPALLAPLALRDDALHCSLESWLESRHTPFPWTQTMTMAIARTGPLLTSSGVGAAVNPSPSPSTAAAAALVPPARLAAPQQAAPTTPLQVAVQAFGAQWAVQHASAADVTLARWRRVWLLGTIWLRVAYIYILSASVLPFVRSSWRQRRSHTTRTQTQTQTPQRPKTD